MIVAAANMNIMESALSIGDPVLTPRYKTNVPTPPKTADSAHSSQRLNQKYGITYPPLTVSTLPRRGPAAFADWGLTPNLTSGRRCRGKRNEIVDLMLEFSDRF
jgi:hypothetical protein